MNKSIVEARKLMSEQKVTERSDNKVVALAIKTHAPISGRDGGGGARRDFGRASCGERASSPN